MLPSDTFINVIFLGYNLGIYEFSCQIAMYIVSPPGGIVSIDVQ